MRSPKRYSLLSDKLQSPSGIQDSYLSDGIIIREFNNPAYPIQQGDLEALILGARTVLGLAPREEFASSFVLWLDNLLEDNNYSHDELKKRTVLEEATKQNLVDKFRVALNKLNLPVAEANTFIDTIANEVKMTNSAPVITLPENAPEFYRKRTDRKEKPDTFIRRVYAPWLGQGILRPHIKDLDLPLYRAIYKHGIPDDFETLLPKAAGRKISAPKQSDLNVLERKRARDRKASRRYYAKKKEKPSI